MTGGLKALPPVCAFFVLVGYFFRFQKPDFGVVVSVAHAQSSPHAFAYVRVLELRSGCWCQAMKTKVNMDLMDEKILRKSANLSEMRGLLTIFGRLQS